MSILLNDSTYYPLVYFVISSKQLRSRIYWTSTCAWKLVGNSCWSRLIQHRKRRRYICFEGVVLLGWGGRGGTAGAKGQYSEYEGGGSCSFEHYFIANDDAADLRIVCWTYHFSQHLFTWFRSIASVNMQREAGRRRHFRIPLN